MLLNVFSQAQEYQALIDEPAFFSKFFCVLETWKFSD